MWAALKQVWTVARHSILQALRMKVALVLVGFMAVLLVVMPYVLKSDQTHEGQAKIFITYSMYLISFVLSVLTLLLSTAALWAEVKGRQILMLDTKPISRGTLLLGKWAGVMLINVVLVAVMFTTTYLLLVFWISRRWPAQWETDADYERYKARVFTARRGLAPPIDPRELMKRVDARYEEYKRKGWLPEDRSEEWIRQQIRQQVAREAWGVKAYSSRRWTIEGIPRFRGWLMFGFRHYGPVGREKYYIRGRFVLNEHGKVVVRIPEPTWVKGKDGKTQMLSLAGNFKGGKHYSFAVTPAVVENGKLEIRYDNQDPDGITAQFPFMGGITVEYPVMGLLERVVFSSSFLTKLAGKWYPARRLVESSGLFSNFVRGGLILLMRLAFLSIVGVFASTFLGFPVAVMLVTTVYFVGQVRTLLFTKMLPNLYIFGSAMQPPWARINQMDAFVRSVVAHFFGIFPSLSQYDMVPALSNGTFIGVGALINAFFWLILVRGTLIGFLAWLIFRRRELATFSPNA